VGPGALLGQSLKKPRNDDRCRLPCYYLATSLNSDLPIAMDVSVPWSVCPSVCLSRSCIVLKRQKISTRFILHTTAPCLSQIVLKFDFNQLTLFLPKFCPQSDPLPVDLSIGGIRSQTAAKWLQIAQRSQWRAYRKPPRAHCTFELYHRCTPIRTTSQYQVSNHVGPNSRRVLPAG